MQNHEQLVTWLRDAHAMERSVEQILARHVAAAADWPEWQTRLRAHQEETRQHADIVLDCLATLGERPSAMKSGAPGFMGAIEGMATAVFRDEPVKNALADYALEHFEIACYSALVSAAEDAQRIEIARACSEILRGEVAMANWLEMQIPELTRSFLATSTAPAEER